ncbi:hypothetical protein V1517DRAFT_359333 [Lipomyces orientalis]|uniref:Uncharacterized protein n=1 Tax=Lipomyces orientalis TaxID=1233043 RepID=A0ACC3TUK3_9ASCO
MRIFWAASMVASVMSASNTIEYMEEKFGEYVSDNASVPSVGESDYDNDPDYSGPENDDSRPTTYEKVAFAMDDDIDNEITGVDQALSLFSERYRERCGESGLRFINRRLYSPQILGKYYDNYRN